MAPVQLRLVAADMTATVHIQSEERYYIQARSDDSIAHHLGQKRFAFQLLTLVNNDPKSVIDDAFAIHRQMNMDTKLLRALRSPKNGRSRSPNYETSAWIVV